MPGKIDQINQIKNEVLALTQSPLFAYRQENNYVPVVGEGSLDAKVVFIGEAPGKNEAETGKPFCGASGKILDKVLESVDLSRAEIYITNIVNDRPPENRDPSHDEIELYAPFLGRQIEIIKPKVVATLGRHSMAYMLEHYGKAESLDTIGKIHGQVFDVITPGGHKFKLIPLHHPAATIYNKESRKNLYEDAKKIKEML